MKNKSFNRYIVTALLALGIAGLAGCTTAPVVTTSPSGTTTNSVTTFLGTPVTPSGLYTQMRGGTAMAAKIAITSDTNSIAYLQAAQQVLTATVSSGTYNPAALASAINAIPKTNIHNPQALEAITSGFALFEIVQPFLATAVNGQNPFVIPALQGIADGIGDALGSQ